MDKLGTLRRTHYTIDLSSAYITKEIVLAGSVAKMRNLGGVIFVDLRDTVGIMQLAFDSSTKEEIFKKAELLRSEYVIMARGTVRARESNNDALKTGDIELFVTELLLLSGAETTPFEIRDNLNVNSELRLKYRYLDLRRDKAHQALLLRHRITKITRDFFDKNNFYEIETPILVKSTPEGARDYLVPSRVQPGRFFALPQSPQLYKQMLMLSGFDRYIQIARCFRDEDLRAERQPEFTQIDLEMSFIDEEDIMLLIENYIKELFTDVMYRTITAPFTRLTYKEAMERFGSDKPDIRFGLELCDLSSVLRSTEFIAFSTPLSFGGSVRCINAKGLADKISRKEIDKLTDVVKTYGAKGLAYTRLTSDGESSSFEKFLSPAEISGIRTKVAAEKGDLILLVADSSNDVVFAALGAIRLVLGTRFELFNKDDFSFLWVTDFPLFEYDIEAKRYVAKHHPFTAPKECDEHLLESHPDKVTARAYDLVLNGYELGGGSMRINNPEMQQKMFKILGFTKERMHESFGYLIEAYKYGAPPHGGLALGLDRLCMLLLGTDSIREVIAFPKVQNSGELMTGCPERVDKKQLLELNIQKIEPKPIQTEQLSL